MTDSGSQPENIMIVDDHVDNLKVLAAILTERGYSVRPTNAPTMVVNAVQKTRPDLILLDIQMPELNGFEICERLKADPKMSHIPIIFLSVLDDVESKVKALRMGGADYITKPFQVEEVIVRVELHLTMQRLQRELKEKNHALQQEVREHKLAREHLTLALNDKDVLLKEVHHRTKNNLLTVSGLLSLQSSRIHDKQMHGILDEMRDRIQSMALVQEQLYRADNVSNLALKEYLIALSSLIFRNYQIRVDRIALNFNMQSVIVPADAVLTCGLVVNELLTNALKYAFPENRGGEVRISLDRLDNSTVILRIRDSGVGIPEEFDIRTADSLGLHLVMMLAERQLRGTVVLQREAGTEWVIQFPCKL